MCKLTSRVLKRIIRDEEFSDMEIVAEFNTFRVPLWRVISSFYERACF
jgi:hypothetical protein